MCKETACRFNGFLDGFAAWQKILSAVCLYGMILTGSWAIVMHSPLWGVLYLLSCAAGFGLVLVPVFCSHCPYPHHYDTCLFAPPKMVRFFSKYRGPEMTLFEKIVTLTMFLWLVLPPQFWLYDSLVPALLFWIFCLPMLLYFPSYFCKHCRHTGCPLNKVPRRFHMESGQQKLHEPGQ